MRIGLALATGLAIASLAQAAPAAGARAEADRLAAAAAAIDAATRPTELNAAWTAALAAAEKAYGPQSAQTARALYGLAMAQFQADETDPAIDNATKALAVAEKLAVRDDKLLADITGHLGDFYVSRHDLDHGIALLKRSHEIRLRVYGERSGETAWTLGQLAAAQQRAGKSREAIALYEQALAIDREVLAPSDSQRLLQEVEFGNAILLTGDLKRGEMILRGAAADSLALPESHPQRIGAFEGVGIAMVNQGRLEEGAEIYSQVMEMRRKSGSIADLADTTGVLGFIRLDQDRPEDAEALFLESRKEFQAVRNPVLAAISTMNAGTAAARRGDQKLGLERRLAALKELEAQPNPSFVAVGLTKFKLADSYAATGDLKAALKTEQEAVEAIRKFRAENSVQRITSDVSLGWIMALNGDTRGGLDLARTAVLRLEADSRKQEIAQIKTTGVRENAEAFGRTLLTAQLADDAETGFHFAQVLIETDAGRAAASQNARVAAGSSEAGEMLKRRRTLMEERLKLEDAAVNSAADAAGAARMKAIDGEVATAEAVLDRDLPDYRALTDPAPIAIAQAQAKLDPGEALIVPVATDEGLFVFALTRDAVAWDRAPVNRLQVRALIARMRAGIDAGSGVRAAVDASGGAKVEARAFDRQAAFELHQAIFTGRIRALTDRARTYTFASSEAFSAAPFAMLVTAPPKGADADPAALRATAWLVRKAAIQVAPSIPAMRAGADGQARAGDFFGAGAPALSGDQQPGAAAGYFRNAGVDVVAVKGLPALPGAAAELRDMADALGPDRSTLLLGERATEGAVKAAELGHVRILAFATHGLVAGDLNGLAEPALVFTPPAQASADDDALLTASEAAQLKLDADWVILSACNTAAGETGRSPGYTGLARAFLLAGGRHVLVSHWPVRDDAAARLTVDTVRAAGKGEAPARALQQAMLRLIADRRVAGGSNPAVWAPFVLVGR